MNARKPEIYKSSHVYYMTENITTICDRVIVSKTDSSLSIVEGHCDKDTEEKTETSFTIVTRDSNGIQCYNGDDHIKVDIESPTGSKSTTEITDSKDGKYTVTYRPECVGQYRVGIEINGQPLTGSPWSAQIVPHQYKLLFQFGSHGNGPGQFNGPCDIAVSEKTGTIAVADYENKRIQLFNSDGNYLREIKLKDRCSTIAFTESGDIIAILVRDDHKISLFTESGQFIKDINDEHLKAPLHVSVGFDGRLIVCDLRENEIRVISPDGMQLLLSFCASDCDGSLWCAVYHQNRFFVSDRTTNYIKVFSKEGKFLYKIGSHGSGDGQLNGPIGLAIDKFNNLIVCDRENGRLQIFRLDGTFFTKFYKIGVGLTELRRDEHLEIPFQVSVGFDGRIIACDWKENEIRVISPDGMQLLLSFRASRCDKSLWCAVYHQDRFFVSDLKANCIKVFSKEGKFLYKIGSQGSGDGQLDGPIGLAIDKFNDLIVCDRHNSRLQIFRLNGTFLTKIEEHFHKDGWAVNYVAVSNDGHVLVTDANNCVHVFQ